MPEFNVVLLFDLDFTLIDNTIGISNSFNHALRKFELPEINTDKIKLMIGAPLEKMFLSLTDKYIKELCVAFREYYGSKGIYEANLLPGVRQKLKELENNGYKLGIITSKKHEMALKLLTYLKLKDQFSFIQGETEKIKTKSNPLIKEFLHEKFPNHEFVVIGDHLNDRGLAEMLNCPFVGVLTGFHSREQLSKNSKTKTLILGNVNDITFKRLENLLSNRINLV